MDNLNQIENKIQDEMQTAIEKAWEALSGYKFWMFGYHAARWVNLNRLLLLPDRKSSPFRDAVKLAQSKIDNSVHNKPLEPTLKNGRLS